MALAAALRRPRPLRGSLGSPKPKESPRGRFELPPAFDSTDQIGSPQTPLLSPVGGNRRTRRLTVTLWCPHDGSGGFKVTLITGRLRTRSSRSAREGSTRSTRSDRAARRIGGRGSLIQFLVRDGMLITSTAVQDPSPKSCRELSRSGDSSSRPVAAAYFSSREKVAPRTEESRSDGLLPASYKKVPGSSGFRGSHNRGAASRREPPDHRGARELPERVLADPARRGLR